MGIKRVIALAAAAAAPLVLAGVLEVPASSAAAVRPAATSSCHETFTTDTGASGFNPGDTGYNEVDIESSTPAGNPCDFRVQARARCHNRTGAGNTAVSGIVAALELEARGTCATGYFLYEGDWRYQETPSGAWSAWFENYP